MLHGKTLARKHHGTVCGVKIEASGSKVLGKIGLHLVVSIHLTLQPTTPSAPVGIDIDQEELVVFRSLRLCFLKGLPRRGGKVWIGKGLPLHRRCEYKKQQCGCKPDNVMHRQGLVMKQARRRDRCPG